MWEPHTSSVTLSEPYSGNSSVSEPHTHSEIVSEPHSGKSRVDIILINVSEPYTCEPYGGNSSHIFNVKWASLTPVV